MLQDFKFGKWICIGICEIAQECGCDLTWVQFLKKMCFDVRLLFSSEIKKQTIETCRMKFPKPIAKHFFRLCLPNPVHSYLCDTLPSRGMFIIFLGTGRPSPRISDFYLSFFMPSSDN